MEYAAQVASGGEARMLLDVLDFAVMNTQGVAFRDQHRLLKAGIALLDRHSLWSPRGATAKRASSAIVKILVQTIYNLFGDAHTETRLFRMADRSCGKECARFVEAFELQRERKVREFWTYSRHGLGERIEH